MKVLGIDALFIQFFAMMVGVICVASVSGTTCQAAEDMKLPSEEAASKATTLPGKEPSLTQPTIKTPLKQKISVKKKPEKFKAALDNGKIVHGSKPVTRAGLLSSDVPSPQLTQMSGRHLTMPTRLEQPPQQPAAIQRLPEIVPLGPGGTERIDAPLRLDWER